MTTRKPKGWRRESSRHALAARGVKSGRKKNIYKRKVDKNLMNLFEKRPKTFSDSVLNRSKKEKESDIKYLVKNKTDSQLSKRIDIIRKQKRTAFLEGKTRLVKALNQTEDDTIAARLLKG